MHIVTLTTDFGQSDYYAGALKGCILRHAALPVVFADISHQIAPYNIVQAAFVLRHAYADFPTNTVHLLSVHNFYDESRRFLAIRHNEHYFLGPDNGVFSLIFDRQPSEIYELRAGEALHSVFGIKDILAQATAHILRGLPLEEIGTSLERYNQRLNLQPIIHKNQIRGSVIHIDHYQNAIINIDYPLFERVGKGRAFEVYFKRHDPVCALSKHYADVPPGDTLCLFNSAGLLELAVHAGQAATLLGLEPGDTVQVEFING